MEYQLSNYFANPEDLKALASHLPEGSCLILLEDESLSVATAGYQFANSDMSGNDYARLAGSAVITGTAFIPLVGPLISIGLGVADSYGVFDDVYNYFE